MTNKELTCLNVHAGTSVYSTDFTLNQIPSNKKIEIDLGKVSYCAETWINGKLVGTRIWPPYRMDITQCVKQGKNKVDVIVANMLANKMHWDIYDDVKAEETNRKWHDGNLLRTFGALIRAYRGHETGNGSITYG